MSNGEACSYIKNTNSHSFILKPAEKEEMMSGFNGISNSSRWDTDGMRIVPVKYVLGLIGPCLVKYLQSLFLTRSFSIQQLQKAKVQVLYNKR